MKLSQIVSEKKRFKTGSSERGKYTGKTVADLEKMKTALEKQNVKRDASTQLAIEKIGELDFTIRARQHDISEKKWIETDPSERGKYDGKTLADLEKMKTALKKQNEKREGSVPQSDKERMAELNFAIRAKQHNL
jgi:hypothetical protein